MLLCGAIAAATSTKIQAQKEASKWYFGQNAGVDFSVEPPQALTDGQLFTEEGCVTISDIEGKLLFYTDGITVYTKQHQPMPNGMGLNGNSSATQSGVVIAHPKTPNLFYLFTVDATAGSKGLCYSLIDMSLNGGMGDVVPAEKNINLRGRVTEKLTATRHHNGKDTWVLVHGWENNEFAAFLVNDKGISREPVLSNAGTTHKGDNLNTQGAMKISPDGKRLALALEGDHGAEFFDFDNKTGNVSRAVYIQLPAASFTYGIEFSSSGNFVYVSAAGAGSIYQFDLSSGNEANIRASQKMIGSTPNRTWVGSLQLAPNGKIYFPIYQTAYLGVINNPNKAGSECGFQLNAVYLGSANASGKMIRATLGLPTFAQHFFIKPITLTPAPDTAKPVVVVKVEEPQPPIIFDGKKEVKKGEPIVLKNVHFAIARHTIKEISFTELNKVVDMMKKNPKMEINIHGHTDNTGHPDANIVLSRQRAESVKEYLVKKGIEPERLYTEGFGATKPLADNNSETGRSINRRVEFILR